MIYIKTTLEAYKKYVNEHNTDRIKKGEKLIIGNVMTNIHPLYEIKYNPLQTSYNTNNTKVNNYDEIVCVFKCYSGNPYRLDIVEIKPENFWLDKKHYNISFTLIGNEDNYDIPTQLGELYEIFKRIMFILNDLDILNSVYVIGDAFDNRKNLFYKDFIGSFGDTDVEIGESSLFEKGNITHYVKKK